MAIVKNDWVGCITGSVYTTASSDAIKPPTGKVFIAITILTADTTFDASGGLVAERRINNTITGSVTNDVYISTEQPAHDLADGSETVDEGSGGLVVDSVDFPAGITLYGRWTEIDVADGAVVAYIGD
jgi:hypothetical protein